MRLSFTFLCLLALVFGAVTGDRSENFETSQDYRNVGFSEPFASLSEPPARLGTSMEGLGQ